MAENRRGMLPFFARRLNDDPNTVAMIKSVSTRMVSSSQGQQLRPMKPPWARTLAERNISTSIALLTNSQ